MSYLNTTRIHFSGYFQSDVSTVNNDVRHFDSEKFQSSYQLPQSPGQTNNGWWNPEGGAAFRFVQCAVTGGVLNGQTIDSHEQDPIIGAVLAGADGRVAGKMVDLDPQQQSVSELWGLKLRLLGASSDDYLDSDYKVAPFMDLWRRQQGGGGGDQTLAAYYHSVLENLKWGDAAASSPLLHAIQGLANGKLSIQFNTFGYKMDSTSPDFTLGRIVGSIGPAFDDEPERFIFGRQMIASLAGGNPTKPTLNIYNFPAQVHTSEQVVSANFGNCLPISNGDGAMLDLGELHFALLKDESIDNGQKIDTDLFESLGILPYQNDNWYSTSGGVADFSYADLPWVISNIDAKPLAIVKKLSADQYQVMVRESIGGLYVRADKYVYRFNPGETAEVPLYASQYGKPIATNVNLSVNNSMIGGGAGPQKLTPPVAVPNIGMPASAISYPASMQTDVTGRGTFLLEAGAAGPGTPRKYMDGQLYGVGYQIADQAANYHSNPWLFVSTLVWTKTHIPDTPAWYPDIQPIMQQYGNLYPIMSKHVVDLGNYESVIHHKEILKLAFSLPVADPNYMPVTRDLSDAKRQMIVKWLHTEDAEGNPIKGDPADSVMNIVGDVTADVSPNLSMVESAKTGDGDELGGKTAFLRSLQNKTDSDQ